MSDTLCTVDPCHIPYRHETDCNDSNCTGCLPGLALDGLYTCNHHHRTAARNLARLPELDAALTRALTTSSSGFSEGGKSANEPGLELNQPVFEFRDHLRERLAAIIGYIATEKGLAGPQKWDVPNVCAWIARHHDWICSSRMAATYVKQTAHLARRGHQLAFPSGTRKFKIGACTKHTTSDDGEREPCTGELTALIRDDRALLPSEIVCDGPEPHTYPPSEWLGLGRALGFDKVNPEAAKHLINRLAG